jgi:hypothetical protein
VWRWYRWKDELRLTKEGGMEERILYTYRLLNPSNL